MPFFRRMRCALHRDFSRQRSRSDPVAVIFVLLLAILAGFMIYASHFLKNIAGEMALSDATDKITSVVNEKINEKMREGQYDYNYFVTLQKDENGDITAISANMTRINTLASDILREVIDSTNSGALDIKIPAGNLTGSNLLIGRGPEIPVRVIMLTSSYSNFRSELSQAGINQVRHQIILELTVEIDVLMPWEMKSSEVKTEVLIAETILVGSVPNTYLSLDTP